MMKLTSSENSSYETLQERTDGVGPDNALPTSGKNALSFHRITLSTLEESRKFTTITGFTKPKVILQDINGDIPRGQLTAVLSNSESESSKRLIHVVGRRKQLESLVPYSLNGAIESGGCFFRADDFSSPHMAFVHRNDFHLGTATVGETLYTAAMLGEKKSKIEMVDCVDFAVHLTELPLTMFCAKLTSLQKKLLSIAVELVRKRVRFMVLENPISELTHTDAFVVIDILKRLCKEQGMTVLCSLVRPSSRIYNSLDQVVLLSKGRVVYFGAAVAAMDYFAQTGEGYHCPEHCNPAEFFLDTLRIAEQSEREAGGNGSGNSKLIESWSETHQTSTGTFKDLPYLAPVPLKLANISTVFHALLKRELRTWTRDPLLGYGAILQSLLISLLVGITAWHLDYDQSDLKAREAVCVLIILEFGLRSLLTTVTTIPTMYELLQRDERRNAYVWLLAKCIILTIHACLISMGVFVYMFMVGLSTEYHSLLCGLIPLTLACAFIGFCVGIAMRTYNATAKVLGPLTIILVLFSPYMDHVEHIVSVFQWIKYISPFYWAYDWLMYLEFDDLDFYCTTKEMTINNGVCPFTTGVEYLDWRDIYKTDLSTEEVPLMVQATGYAVLSLLFFRWRCLP